MKKMMYSLGLLLMAGLTFAACSSDITNDEASRPDGKWTATVTLGKHVSDFTRSLVDYDDGKLSVVWETTDKVTVLKGTTVLGTLSPSVIDGKTATLTGTLESNTFAVGDVLTLAYPNASLDYSGQDGTLSGIAEKFDFAQCETTVAAVSGSSVTLTDATLVSQQAIVRFTFNESVTSVTVKATTLDDAITASVSGGATTVYMALPLNTEDVADYTVVASSGLNYKIVRHDISMANGKFYTANITIDKSEMCIPLTIQAMGGGTTVTITNPLNKQITYSVNGGTKRSTSDNPINIALAANEKVELWGNNVSYSDGTYVTSIITSDNAYLYGNVNSLLSWKGFEDISSLSGDYTFRNLFEGGSLFFNSPSHDILLPATTLSESCYTSMFYGCSNLERAPVLPAPTLTTGCYSNMFEDCTALTSVTCLATNVISSTYAYCTPNWLKNVSLSGTFYKDAGTTWDTSSYSAVPPHWTILDAE